jgi:hypothetical protein
VQLERVVAIPVCCLRRQRLWQVNDRDCVVRTLLGADAAPNAQVFRYEGSRCFFVDDDALLALPDDRTVAVALLVAFFRLATIFVNDCYANVLLLLVSFGGRQALLVTNSHASWLSRTNKHTNKQTNKQSPQQQLPSKTKEYHQSLSLR